MQQLALVIVAPTLQPGPLSLRDGWRSLSEGTSPVLGSLCAMSTHISKNFSSWAYC